MTPKEIQAQHGAIHGADFDPNNGGHIPFSLSIEGLESTGKTHFALMTCPLPIVHINFGDRDATMKRLKKLLLILVVLQVVNTALGMVLNWRFLSLKVGDGEINVVGVSG